MSKHNLISSVAILALMSSTTVLAQSSTDDTIVVTGIKSSLKDALDVKRNSNQIVDAIAAEDVGKFPDKNIADALQRITGVSIDRTGGEGQFITVRGLGPEFNTVLVNGRTMATDNDGREFSFDVLSSDIISRADVYKSPTARLQEGGIGATVNIVTARPLDLSGTNISLSAGGIYTTLDEETSPELSGTFSYTNPDKTFGVVAGVSYSDRSSQIDHASQFGWVFRPQTIINGTADSVGLTAADSATSANAIHIPNNLKFDRELSDRERLTANLTFQGKLSDTVEWTVDGLYSEFDVSSIDQRITPFFTAPFIDVDVNENGTVTGFNRPGQDFVANNPALDVSVAQNDNVITSGARNAEAYQLGGNLKWNATDNLLVTADISTSNATRFDDNPTIVIGSLATTAPRYNLNIGNDIPEITNQGVLTDASLLRHHVTRVRQNLVEDDIFEARLEGDWNLDKGPLETLSFGALFSSRQKTRENRQSPAIAQRAYTGYGLPVDPSLVRPITFNDFLSDASGAPTPVGFVYDLDAIFAELSRPENINNPQRQPSLSATEFAENSAALLALGPNIFAPVTRPSNGSDVTEDVTSVFVSGTFGGDFAGELPWTANVGVRFTHTDVTSEGFGQEIISIFQPAGDNLLEFNFGPDQVISVSNSYSNILPSANVKFDLTDDKVLRASVSKTVTRPTLSSLGTNNTFGGQVTNAISSGGNPELEPFESTNYDISYEWYYGDAGFFGITGFHKEFTNFLESQTLPVVRQFTDDLGNVGPITFNDTRTRNGEEGSISGLEVALQHTINAGPLDGFGALANYTYVTSNVQRAAGSAAADCDYEGLSPHSYNLSGFYEKNGLQARLAYNWRDEFLNTCFGPNSRPVNTQAYGQLDFTAAYDINQNFQIFASGINILDEDIQQFSVLKERFFRYEDTGSRYTVGVRAKF